MATINSPKTRTVNLALYDDGSWKVISDLPVSDVAAQVTAAASSINNYSARVASGEQQADEADDNDPGVVVTTVDTPVAAVGQV